MKTISLPSCCKIAPIPSLEAFIPIINGLSKFGRASTYEDSIACFSVINAYVAYELHLKLSFFITAIKGLNLAKMGNKLSKVSC